MKKSFIYSLILLLSVSCIKNKKENIEENSYLFIQPQKIVQKNNNNEFINRLINSFGDTVFTGVPVPIKGNIINKDSIKKPVRIKINNPKYILAKSFVRKVDSKIPEIKKINPNKIKIGEGDSKFILVNKNGDTISTGIPIVIKGEKVNCIQPKPVKSLISKFKDNAIINIQYLDVDEGMSSSYVFCNYLDKRGNLWIGTEGGGVSFYDGEYFTHFTQNEGLSSNIIRTIIEDKRGNLWFGTEGGGVTLYDGEFFTHFTEKEGLSSNTIISILEDKNGNIWFGTLGGGVTKYNGETFIHFTTKEGLSNNNILSILEDVKGNLWFGTWGGGLCRFDGELFTHFTTKEGLPNNNIQAIHEDKRGNIWLGTLGGGISKFGGKSFINFTTKEGLSNNYVTSICEDKNGIFWFGTEGGGVNRYDGETFAHITTKEGLSNNIVWSILDDKSGNLWFGSEGGGINCYKEGSFVNITIKQGLSNNNVWSITEDSQENLWFGTANGGVCKYDGEYFFHYTKKQGLSSDIVLSILEDSKGNIWFGTADGGVCKYDGEYFSNYTKEHGLFNSPILSIIEDGKGNVWFGSLGEGVCRFDGKYFIHFTENEGLLSNNIRSIIEDASGKIWFGTEGGGLCKYDGKTLTHFTENEGLSSNNVLSILEDKEGKIWIGTIDQGISFYDGKKFYHITTEEGLSNNTVWSILEDRDGKKWISTEKGLNKIIQQDSGNFNNILVQNFFKNDGLKGLDFLSNSAYIDSKNRIWWGSGKSLTMLDTNRYSISTKTPQIQLNRILINEEHIDFHNFKQINTGINYSKAAKFYNYPENLDLNYDKNHITFYFSAIDWNSPHKIKYSYKLVGQNNNWSRPSSEAKVDYKNLSSGSYTLKIRSIGSANKWSEIFEYKFKITPPWWHTIWAYLIYLICFIIAVFLFIYWRTQKLKQHQQMLESKIKTATSNLKLKNEEVEKQKKEVSKQLLEKEILLKEVHHRVKNNMQIISSLLELQANNTKNIEVQEIAAEGQSRIESMALVHQMLYSNSSLSNIKFKEYIEFLSKQIFSTYNKLNKITFKCDIADIEFDLDKSIALGLIVNELVSNSLKYAFENKSGEIEIQLKKQKGKCKLTIRDNGKGFPDNFKVDKSDTLGLKLVKMLAREIRAELLFFSSKGVEVVLKFDQ